LTRLQQKRWGNPQAQCLGGLEVDDELKARHHLLRADQVIE